MSTQEIAEAVMALPEKERLELARRIVTSIESEDVSARIGDLPREINGDRQDVGGGKDASLFTS